MSNDDFQILVADDNDRLRSTTARLLKTLGYSPIEACDGVEALEVLTQKDGPLLALVDWNMPRADGLEVCTRLKALNLDFPIYVILLTVRNSTEDIARGLDAGASDFVSKPFEVEELRARLEVGRRVVALQGSLNERVHELQKALDQIKTLHGLLPMCMHCHKIRDDKQVWQRLERYITEHSSAEVSHGLCPECLKTHYTDVMDKADAPDDH